MGSRIIGTVISVIAGIGLLGFGAWELHRASAASSWPTAEGTVESSRITTSSGRKGGTKYYCKAEYKFSVGSRTYRGNTVYLVGSPTSSSTAQSDLARFAAGKPCEVHYKPDDPSDCCLEIGSNTTAWFLIGLGAILGIAGAFQGVRVFLP